MYNFISIGFSKYAVLNPNNPSLYDKGTPEYQNELIAYNNYERFRRLAIFTDFNLARQAERMANMFSDLESNELYKDMAAIFNRTFIAYWILGLPIGYILAMTDWIVQPMGAHGFWIGFIIGLSSAALMLGLRLRWMHRQPDNIQLEFASK